MHNIGHNIKEVLEAQGHTATWLAERIGVSRTHIYRIFRKENIDVMLLLRISRALGHDFFAYYSRLLDSNDDATH